MKNYHPAALHRRLPHSSPAIRRQPSGGKFSLLSIHEEIQLPAASGFAGGRRFKLLQIEQAAVAPDQPIAPRPELMPQAMNTPRLRSSFRREPLSQIAAPEEVECMLDGRRVRLRGVAQVLADDAGNFFARQGEQLRQLGELVTDERGKLFEVFDHPNHSSPPATAPPPSNGKPNGIGRKISPNSATPAQTAVANPPETAPAEALPGYRKIFAEPGIRIQIALGRVKNEIAPQLQHPDNIDVNALVECYAQIYEAQRAMAVAKMAAAEFGDAALQTQFHPLTKDKANMLGAPQLFKPTSPPFETEATTRRLYPGQRVYSLRPIFDPTLAPLPRAVAPVVESRQELRRQIPSQYLNPLHFKYAREEVLYDMKATLGTLPPAAGAIGRWLFIYPLRLLKTLGLVLTSKARIKKWRAMLAGKNLDEQLWAVTPPRGFAYHPALRRWAEETLARAGYEAERMLLEWEIFWRRKG